MSASPQQFKSLITAEEINALPLGAFEGKSIVIINEEGARKALKEINQHTVVGFDTETRPVFVSGQHHPVALIQVAIPNAVFLFRVKYTGMTPELIAFLQNEKILKVGVALRDDIKALQKLRRFKPGGIFELTELSKKANIEVEGLKKLTALVLGFRISKSAQTSNWEAEQLNEKQILYAATDAWVCLEIYWKLFMAVNGGY
jgi:ribonuclease D